MDYMLLDANKAMDEGGTQEANYSTLRVKKWKRLAKKSQIKAQPKQANKKAKRGRKESSTNGEAEMQRFEKRRKAAEGVYDQTNKQMAVVVTQPRQEQ